MFISYIRAMILYALLILAVRLMGKRQIGELEPSEFVVAILIADLASVPMQDIGIPLFSGVIPILTVLAMELILSVLSLRFRKLRRFLSGNPIVLMENGTILKKNLLRTRVTTDELVQHLRGKTAFWTCTPSSTPFWRWTAGSAPSSTPNTSRPRLWTSTWPWNGRSFPWRSSATGRSWKKGSAPPAGTAAGWRPSSNSWAAGRRRSFC